MVHEIGDLYIEAPDHATAMTEYWRAKRGEPACGDLVTSAEGRKGRIIAIDLDRRPPVRVRWHDGYVEWTADWKRDLG